MLREGCNAVSLSPYQKRQAEWVVRFQGHDKDGVLLDYWRSVVPYMEGRLSIILELKRALKHAIAVAAADIRCGKSQCDHSGENCHLCDQLKSNDMFVCGSVILCGNCRYFLRTGRQPPPKHGRFGRLNIHHASCSSAREDEDRYTTHTINRWRPTEIRSQKHFDVLWEIEMEDIAKCREIKHD